MDKPYNPRKKKFASDKPKPNNFNKSSRYPKKSNNAEQGSDSANAYPKYKSTNFRKDGNKKPQQDSETYNNERPRRAFSFNKPKADQPAWENKHSDFKAKKEAFKGKIRLKKDKPATWQSKKYQDYNAEGSQRTTNLKPKINWNKDSQTDKLKSNWDKPKSNWNKDSPTDKPKSNWDKPKGNWNKDSQTDKPYSPKPYKQEQEGEKKKTWINKPKEGNFYKKNKFDNTRPPQKKFISEAFFSDDFSYNDSEANDKKDFLKKREALKKAKSVENFKSNTPARGQKKKRNFNSEAPESDEVRLNKFIADSGVCSRREADTLIQEAHITVNGEIVVELGTKVHPKKDVVRYKGKVLRPEKFVYVLLNKPKDYITTTEDEEGRKTVMELVQNACPERIYPVGRLDRNTTGLLLFTNDGELAEKLTHPSFEMRKVYQVALNKPITATDFTKLVEGFELEDGFVKLDDVAIITPDKTVLGLEIHSGRNRIVRRIFEHLGYEVDMLDRTMFAGLNKKNLPRGKWRLLTQQEVYRLKYLT